MYLKICLFPVYAVSYNHQATDAGTNVALTSKDSQREQATGKAYEYLTGQREKANTQQRLKTVIAMIVNRVNKKLLVA